MRIILSPAKKMKQEPDLVAYDALPELLSDTEVILSFLRSRSYEELKSLWACNEKIAEQNIERLKTMDLRSFLTPAILSYDGIAYQYMAPSVFQNEAFLYIQEHLRILSAFYGVLRPMDGVTPYRLEMQAKAKIGDHKNLYDFWGSKIYEEVPDDSRTIINLASEEYAKCVRKYLKPSDRFITVTFMEYSHGKAVTKGTYAKMARGEMVRFMAERGIKDPEEIKQFDRMDYKYRDDLSCANEFVFERKTERENENKGELR